MQRIKYKARHITTTAEKKSLAKALAKVRKPRQKGSKDLTAPERETIRGWRRHVHPQGHEHAGEPKYSIRWIATATNRSWATINRLVHGKTHTKPRSGRKPVSANFKAALTETYLHLRHKHGTNKKRRRSTPIQLAMDAVPGFKWSKTTARSILRESKLRARRSRVRPFQSKTDRKVRLAWGRKHRRLTREHFQKNVVFLDCKCFAVRTTVLQKMKGDARDVLFHYRTLTEGLLEECTRSSKGSSKPGGKYVVRIYAAVADGKMVMWQEYRKWNGERAAELTQKLRANCRALWPEKEVVVLCHDNDWSFNGKVNAAAERKHGFELFSIPPRSPEFMPLDYAIWVWILERMREQERDMYPEIHETAAQYKDRLRSIAMSVPADVINRVIGCMVDHIEQVVHHKGGHWQDGQKATRRWRQRRLEREESQLVKRARVRDLLQSRRWVRAIQKKHGLPSAEDDACDDFFADPPEQDRPEQEEEQKRGESPASSLAVLAALAVAKGLSSQDDPPKGGKSKGKSSPPRGGSPDGKSSPPGAKPPSPPKAEEESPAPVEEQLGGGRVKRTTYIESKPVWFDDKGKFRLEHRGLTVSIGQKRYRVREEVFLEGFEEHPMPPDGSCLFHAFGLFASPTLSATEARELCAAQIRTDMLPTQDLGTGGDQVNLTSWLRQACIPGPSCVVPSRLQAQVGVDKSLETVRHAYASWLLERPKRSGRKKYATWGGFLEMGVLAQCLDLTVRVYEPVDGGCFRECGGEPIGRGTNTAHLLWTGGTHYNVLMK